MALRSLRGPFSTTFINSIDDKRTFGNVLCFIIGATKINTIKNNLKIQNAIQLMLLERDINFAVTLTFNRSESPKSIRTKLCKWTNRIDRKLLGKRYVNKSSKDRMFYIASVEHHKTNIHYHLLISIPNKNKHSYFLKYASTIWTKLVRSGTVYVDHLLTKMHKTNTIYYCTTEYWSDRSIEDFVISTEFHPN